MDRRRHSRRRGERTPTHRTGDRGRSGPRLRRQHSHSQSRRFGSIGSLALITAAIATSVAVRRHAVAPVSVGRHARHLRLPHHGPPTALRAGRGGPLQRRRLALRAKPTGSPGAWSAGTAGFRVAPLRPSPPARADRQVTLGDERERMSREWSPRPPLPPQTIARDDPRERYRGRHRLLQPQR